ncbi:MAG: DUF4838 domain-containing protein [Limisphaerales bacterium]
MKHIALCLAVIVLSGFQLTAQIAGASGRDDLLIADATGAKATVIVAPGAGKGEKQAATDLVKYIELMTGAKPALADTAEAVGDALKGKSPLLIVGEEALKADASLKAALAKAAKPNPTLRADAFIVRRKGNRVLLAGNHDEAHYYAAAHLLHLWGCRWYLPTDFGECIPQHAALKVGALDFAYGSPFEVRHYWLSWNANTLGEAEFQRRNFGNNVNVPSGHALGKYTKDLVPKGKTMYNVPIAEDATAEHVAKQVVDTFGKGQHVMLGLEDGLYESDSPKDKELKSGYVDKYFLTPSMTDAFMVFYNGVARRLTQAHPTSPAKIGFLAYANITLPPQRDILAEKPLVAYLAPIDIDPIHGMDDPKSPPRQEYREMMYRWAHVMQGRVAIYDYDQGMLVWRDMPNPAITAIRQDIKHYRKAGILGISTESRGAMATTFLNLHVRLQLAWNPDADVDKLLVEFYPKFYGPAAAPMEKYWTAINKAWDDSIVTEHEHFVAPAIYTPALVKELKQQLLAAEALIKPLAAKAQPDRNEKLLVERIKFTRLSFDVLENYMAMVTAAATDTDFKAAAAAGERALAARLTLANMNPTFTTRVIGVAAESDKSGPAWFPGEVKQYRDLLALTDGTKGKLIAKTPLEWAFRRDPHDTGLPAGWAYREPDLNWWKSQKDKAGTVVHQQNPGHWEMLRTDLYAQAQGVITPDFHSYTGHAWYRTELDLKAADTQGKARLMFPGLFNECWLYVNGSLVAHREQKTMWWYNDYKFEWDVDVSGHLKPGKNSVTVRLHNPHHFGGIFRRPFLYRPVGP